MSFTPYQAREVKQGRWVVSTYSVNCSWGEQHMGRMFATGVASTAWPAANCGIFLPVMIYERCIAYEAFYATGTLVATDNLDIGIFSTSGSRLHNVGATARGAASTWFNLAMTDYTWEPGEYYIGMASAATNNFIACAPTASVAVCAGVCEDASSLTAGAFDSSVTLIRTTRAYVPHFGFNLRSVSI